MPERYDRDAFFRAFLERVVELLSITNELPDLEEALTDVIYWRSSSMFYIHILLGIAKRSTRSSSACRITRGERIGPSAL